MPEDFLWLVIFALPQNLIAVSSDVPYLIRQETLRSWGKSSMTKLCQWLPSVGPCTSWPMASVLSVLGGTDMVLPVVRCRWACLCDDVNCLLVYCLVFRRDVEPPEASLSTAERPWTAGKKPGWKRRPHHWEAELSAVWYDHTSSD